MGHAGAGSVRQHIAEAGVRRQPQQAGDAARIVDGDGQPLRVGRGRAACCLRHRCDSGGVPQASTEPKRSAARARAFAASTSRSRGGAVVTRESSSSWATSVTRSTARLKTASLALEGRVVPLSLRTNCSAEARTSSSVAGGLKLCRVLMLRHMGCSVALGDAFKLVHGRLFAMVGGGTFRLNSRPMDKQLDAYRAKRDFTKTPEPAGGRAKTGGNSPSGNSYVIQKHAARRMHYDFRLELNGVLKSWAVPEGPSLIPGKKRLAVHVE